MLLWCCYLGPTYLTLQVAGPVTKLGWLFAGVARHLFWTLAPKLYANSMIIFYYDKFKNIIFYDFIGSFELARTNHDGNIGLGVSSNSDREVTVNIAAGGHRRWHLLCSGNADVVHSVGPGRVATVGSDFIFHTSSISISQIINTAPEKWVDIPKRN